MKNEKKLTRRDALKLAVQYQQELVDVTAERNVIKMSLSHIHNWVNENLDAEQRTLLSQFVNAEIRKEMDGKYETSEPAETSSAGLPIEQP